MAPDNAGKSTDRHTDKEMVPGEIPEFMTIHEIARKAQKRISRDAWDYLMGGCETETTLRRNRLALDSIALKPRVLRDVSKVDLSTTLLGRKLRMPVMLAPIGSIESFEPLGGVVPARAADAFDICHMLSSQCKPGLEAVAEAADNLRIFQLYVRGDKKWTNDIVKRAKANGFAAFCFTVDSAHYSRRERDIAKRYVKGWRVGVQGLEYQRGLSWDEVDHFKDNHPDYPLIIKGIATAEDAETALEHGVNGIYVSNHGGRQLDHGRGSMDVLPEVVKAAKGKAMIFVDGGFLRGTDFIKAKAMGADVIGIGKLQGLALSAGSEAALIRVLEILEHEMMNAMALNGITSFDELDQSSLVFNAPRVAAPDATSALPLLCLDDKGY